MSAVFSKPLLEGLARGAALDAEALLAPLSESSVAARARANAEIAEALFAAGRAKEAESFAERAFRQSANAAEFVPLYVDIQKALGQPEQVRAASRRAGIGLARQGCAAEAIALFNQSQYAYERAGMGDRYEHDAEILETVDGLAELHQAAVGRPAAERRPGPLRVAYLVYGAAHQGSVLIRLLSDFARHHRREKVEARFYVPESPRTARHAPYIEELSANAARLEAAGATLVCADAAGELEAWLATARAIREFDADVLVTTALLADYSHYFIAALRPARRIVGLGLGPPAQYAAPGLDWVVCATRHPMMDMPCDASVVEFETTPPERPAPADRSALGIPAGAPLVVVAGRAHKFLDRGYWAALGRILDQHPEAWLLVIGLETPPAFLDEVFSPAARARFRLCGWRTDYLALLAMADVVLDTWPSGGGFTLTDAQAFGIPVAGMKNDYLRAFDQTAWNPAEEFTGAPELMAPRGDFAAQRAIVGGLIADPAHRREMGERCRKFLHERRSDPARMVRRHEEIYERVAAAPGERPACGLAHAAAAGRPALARRHDWGRAPSDSMFARALRRLRRALTS